MTMPDTRSGATSVALDDVTGAGLSRRAFVTYALAGALLGGVSARAQPREQRKPLAAIDTLVLADPAMEPAPAVAAGISAVVLDMSLYPRTFERAVAEIERWNAIFARADSGYFKVLRGQDLARAREQSKLGVILACQDASILGPSTYSVNDENIRNLEHFHAQGLRVLQITHNERNALGDSYQEKTNAGLSRLGEAVVAAMNRLRMMIDLSHCGERTTLESIALSSRPCAVTHAGCRALYDTGRAKSDAVIRALADKGGYFGIFNMSMWLTDADTASVDTVVDHIDHVVQLAGVDHVGFGSDGPLAPNRDLSRYLAGMKVYLERTRGIPGSERIPAHVVVPELDSVHRMERLASALARRGYAASAIDKIIGGNFARIFTEVCG